LVFSRLHTQINLLTEWRDWIACAVIIIVATAGKLGGCTLVAKTMGESWRDALSIGSLMNTRGLMELIVLNIGYDLKILSSEIFAILVIMALTTTLLTNPLLNLIDHFKE
jgi:Kef-type K+ transport system membrane component KefB